MKIFDFLRDDSPYSTMRVTVFLIQVLFFPCFVYTWTYLSITKQMIMNVPDGVIWLVGVTLGFKTLQKGIEVVKKNGTKNT